MNRFTRQGIRDLSHIRVPKKSRTFAPLPELMQQELCKHKNTYKEEDHSGCEDCGVVWEKN